jgi:hypothetical protein
MLENYRAKKKTELAPEVPDTVEELREFIKDKLDYPLPIREGQKYHHLNEYMIKLWKSIAWSYALNKEAKYIYCDDEDRDFELDEDMYIELKPDAINLATWVEDARAEFLDACRPITALVADRSVYDKHYLYKQIKDIAELKRLAKSENESFFLTEITPDVVEGIILESTQHFFPEIISERRIKYYVKCNKVIGVSKSGGETCYLRIDTDGRTGIAHAYPCDEQEALQANTLLRPKKDEIDFDCDIENPNEEREIKLLCNFSFNERNN